jgi:glycosyltransferase involved in cell wall biosynthesis
LKNQPHLSVLLPCRDAERTIDDALESLVQQTYDNLEVVAVNDGSTDATASRLAVWAERDSRIRVIETEPAGIVSAINAAAAKARGDLLVRMDADDISANQRLERQVMLLHEHPDFAGCGTQIRYFPRSTLRDGARRYESWINSVNTPAEIERDLFVECPIPHPTLAIRRSAFEAVGGYHETGWPEDYDLVLRLNEADFRLGKVPEVLLHWRERPDRLSRTDPRYSEDAFRKCKVHFLGARVRDRPVVVCGAGPVGKAFAIELQAQDHTIVAFVDLDPRKLGQTIHGAPVIEPTDITAFPHAYFLAAVASVQARQEIRNYLSGSGRKEMDDFCAVA